MANRATISNPLPNGRLSESRTQITDPDALRARIRELEALCGEVYIAAVELGLPQALLNRLWTIGARGSSPLAYDVDMPPRPAAPNPSPAPAVTAATPEPTAKKIEMMPLPDIKLADRPKSDTTDAQRAKPSAPELKDLPVRRTVLVVDDDPMMLEVLVRILQRENYELITALSGADALRQAAALDHPVDLLITDYAMPAMKGRELADKMRERNSAVRVLYQTGFSDMLFENRAELEEGAAFLEKPFTARGLREAARFILFGTINPSIP